MSTKQVDTALELRYTTVKAPGSSSRCCASALNSTQSHLPIHCSTRDAVVFDKWQGVLEACSVIEQPWADLVLIDEVLVIHAECIRRFGGDSPEPKEGCVEGSLGAAWNAELYSGSQEALQDLCFAGCLLFYLVRNHCFVDGNNVSHGMEILRSLGLTVNATDEEAEMFCLDVITGRGLVKKAVDVCLWIAPTLEALPD